MTPATLLPGIGEADGLRYYAKAGTNEGANALTNALFAREIKFALVQCLMICEVTDLLGLRFVKRTPVDTDHPHDDWAVLARCSALLCALAFQRPSNFAVNIAFFDRLLFFVLFFTAHKGEL